MKLTAEELRARHSPEVTNLKVELRKEREKLTDYSREHGKLSNLIGDVIAEVKVAPAIKVVPYVIKKQSVTAACSAVLHLTDIHWGAVQDRNEVEGFGEYDPDIAEKRLRRLVVKVLDWVTTARATTRIDELVVIITGDLISGAIHKELQVTNAYPAPVQSVKVAMLLAELLIMLAGHFKTVRVEMTFDDNHSRLEIKPQCKEAGLNNYNYVIAALIKETVKAQTNIDFRGHTELMTVIEVQGRRYLTGHGHNVQGWMGFPYYGIERMVARESIRRMNGPDTRKFHRVVIGHWHAPMAHPLFWIGGSVSGTDAYDHKCSRSSEPMQTGWLVHPKYREFNRCEFLLT